MSSSEGVPLQVSPQTTAAQQIEGEAAKSRSPSVVPVTAQGSGKGTTTPQPQLPEVSVAPSTTQGVVSKPAAVATSEAAPSSTGAALQSSPSLGSAEAEESKYAV